MRKGKLNKDVKNYNNMTVTKKKSKIQRNIIMKQETIFKELSKPGIHRFKWYTFQGKKSQEGSWSNCWILKKNKIKSEFSIETFNIKYSIPITIQAVKEE